LRLRHLDRILHPEEHHIRGGYLGVEDHTLNALKPAREVLRTAVITLPSRHHVLKRHNPGRSRTPA
jgi:hypothetical protein